MAQIITLKIINKQIKLIILHQIASQFYIQYHQSSQLQQNMISKLLKNSLSFYFSTGSIRRIGRQAVPQLPNVIIPTKPKPLEDERLSTNLAYETFSYLKKDRLPNCRYFALEYENRIFHFYNAYYYPLGRMINRVGSEIRGKNSPHYKSYAANIKNGDMCVIVNIEDPLVTGKKLLFKKFRYHTGFVGHLREYTYKHILNHKPELLYHHLLRRTMPKNKLSEKYLENLVLCRGPTHNYSNFPQFSPDKRIYDYLPETDIYEMVKNDASMKVASESQPGLAQQLFNKSVDPFISRRDIQQSKRQLGENVEDLSQIYEDAPKFKTVPAISKKKYMAMKTKEKSVEARYIPIRAPYKKKDNATKSLNIYKSEKQARKDPNYQLLRNQQLQEIDQENTAPNPHIIGGGVKKQ